MKLHILFGQRKCRYEGEYAPEVLLCWDQIDENPVGWGDAVVEAQRRYGTEMSSMRVVLVEVNQDEIKKLLTRDPVTIKGKVSES